MGDIWVPIIVSIVTGLASVGGVIISTSSASKLMDAKLEKTQAVFEAHVTEQIKNLQGQVEKHNKVIERTFRLEERASVQDERIKALEGGLK